VSQQNLQISGGTSPIGTSHQTTQTPQAEKLIPVNIQFSENKDTITLNRQTLTINYQQAVDRQLLKTSSQQVPSNIQLTPQALIANELKALLQVVGNTQYTDLPRGLLAYIKGNHISLPQLTNLAERPQGYPIGEAKIVNNLAVISPSIRFNLPAGLLANGDYTVSLVRMKGNLQLALTPKLAQISVTLSSEQGQLTKAITHDSSTSSINQKISLVSSYGQWSHALEKHSLTREQLVALAKPLADTTHFKTENLPLALQKSAGSSSHHFWQVNIADTKTIDPILKSLNARVGLAALTQILSFKAQPQGSQAAQTSTAAAISTSTPANQGLTQSLIHGTEHLLNKLGGNSSDNSSSDAKAMHRGLNQALNLITDKAGSATNNHQSVSKLSLLTLIRQLQPLAFPRPLGELAAPTLLQQELVDSVAASVASSGLPKLATSSHSSTIGILFQLLLGRQHQQSNSARLNQHLAQLQQKLGMGSTLLNLLDRANTGDVMGKLISGLTLYQQASSDTTQATNWYFTLPYTLDSRQEELEGHFEQNKEEDHKGPRWRLQLKFNLSLGTILMNAEVTHNRLKLGFTSDSEELLSQLDSKLPPLSQKISAIGLVTDSIVTHKAKVPASLLPGEHYLVKIKA
jgi:hypothetical protein